jgi:hypothetical protein
VLRAPTPPLWERSSSTHFHPHLHEMVKSSTNSMCCAPSNWMLADVRIIVDVVEDLERSFTFLGGTYPCVDGSVRGYLL